MRTFRLILVIILLIMANNLLFAQKIKIERNDVDSSRANFITAGHLFSINIIIDDLDSVSSASFDLNYTQSNYIKFSDAVHTDFGRGGRKPVVIHNVDTANNRGNVYIGVIAADTLGGRGFDNPVIITLEFVVAPNAPNGLVSTFSFNRPQAVVTQGVIGDLIKTLESEPRDFIIHGFIEVWPGDADNDGEVTSMDVTQIGRYIGYGASKHFQMRSFKRRNASTIWLPQYCMGWDSVAVTYADCDGNGDVTVTDQLIVAINFFKIHNAFNSNYSPKIIINDSVEPEYEKLDIEANDYTDIYIKSNSPIYSVAGTINWVSLDNYSKIVDIKVGDLFPDSYFYKKIDVENNIIHISNLQLNQNKVYKNEGRFCRVIIKGDINQIKISQDIWGVNESDNIIKINSFSNIDEEKNNFADFDVKYLEDLLMINSNNFNNLKLHSTAEIYNINGELIDKFVFNKEITRGVNLENGVYFLIINNFQIRKIIVNK